MDNKQHKSTKATKAAKPGYEFVGVRIPGPLKTALEAYAEKEGIFVSQALRRIIQGNTGIKEAMRQSRTP